jgi:hypothetical protein
VGSGRKKTTFFQIVIITGVCLKSSPSASPSARTEKAAMILRTTNSRFVDVAHVASSLGGFLKSGVGAALGTFGLRGPNVVSSPKPSDSPTVLIFVLGGITAREIRDVRAAAADVVGNAFSVNENGAKVEDILVGSTGLLRASGEDLVAMVA